MIIRPDKEHRVIDSQREMCSIKSAMAHMNVCRQTIYRYMKIGKIDYCRTANGFVRIYVDSLTVDKNANITKS